MIDTKHWQQLLQRNTNANKYDFGHVLVIGGSPAMVGAPVLSARAALRVGVGLATIASTKDTTELIDRDIEETMTLTLPNWNNTKKVIAKIIAFIKERNVTVIIVGPGLPETADFTIRQLLPHISLPLVIDAHAISALSNHLSILKQTAQLNKSIVLTPHTGEYARLTNATVIEFAKEYAITLVLKQHQTIVANSKETYHNTTGNAGLATAGTGDVLTGIIGGLLAQNFQPFVAASMAVFLHGLSGDIISKQKTEAGIIASDIIETIPAALKQVQNDLNN